jgi:methionyl-tRNA synthetase
VPAGDPSFAGSLPGLPADVAIRYEQAMENLLLSEALAAVWDVVGEANRYLVEREPWALAKDSSRRAELEGVMYASAELLRIVAVFISPIMPTAAAELWRQLGIGEPLELQRLPGAARWGLLAPGTKTSRGDALFPRLDG